jgi:hypothetical protein
MLPTYPSPSGGSSPWHSGHLMPPHEIVYPQPSYLQAGQELEAADCKYSPEFSMFFNFSIFLFSISNFQPSITQRIFHWDLLSVKTLRHHF